MADVRLKKERIPWNKDKKLSDEHRRNLSEAHKGKTTWNKGISMKEDTKRKLSEAKKGKMAIFHAPAEKKGKK